MPAQHQEQQIGDPEAVGYRLITQIPFVYDAELEYENIIVSRVMVENIPLITTLSEQDIDEMLTNYAPMLDYRYIQICLHLPSFHNGNNTGKLIQKLMNNSPDGCRFGFISERFNEKKDS
mgnify:CR=1 FL=1